MAAVCANGAGGSRDNSGSPVALGAGGDSGLSWLDFGKFGSTSDDLMLHWHIALGLGKIPWRCAGRGMQTARGKETAAEVINWPYCKLFVIT
jgi:hypothetical protein